MEGEENSHLQVLNHKTPKNQVLDFKVDHPALSALPASSGNQRETMEWTGSSIREDLPLNTMDIMEKWSQFVDSFTKMISRYPRKSDEMSLSKTHCAIHQKLDHLIHQLEELKGRFCLNGCAKQPTHFHRKVRWITLLLKSFLKLPSQNELIREKMRFSWTDQWA